MPTSSCSGSPQRANFYSWQASHPCSHHAFPCEWVYSWFLGFACCLWGAGMGWGRGHCRLLCAVGPYIKVHVSLPPSHQPWRLGRTISAGTLRAVRPHITSAQLYLSPLPHVLWICCRDPLSFSLWGHPSLTLKSLHSDCNGVRMGRRKSKHTFSSSYLTGSF